MYYCDLPLHADVGFDMGTAKGFWMVTSNQCRSPGPGLYTSWRSTLAICAGIQDAEPVLHETVASALPSWYECCRMGQHAHPIDPMVVSPSRQGPGAPSPGQAHSSTQYAIGADRAAAPTTPMATRTAPAAVSDAHLQAGSTLSFAVSGGEVVYSDIGPAFQHFERVRLTHGAAELMGTHNYFKALFFASGMDERNADQLGCNSSRERITNIYEWDARRTTLASTKRFTMVNGNIMVYGPYIGRLHIGPRSVSAHSSDFVQGSPVGREPVRPTPLPRDASAVVKPGPSSCVARPASLKVSPSAIKQASATRLRAIQESLDAQSKPSLPEKKRVSLARLVAIQGLLLERTQQQQQQKKAEAAKQEKPAVVKQEKPVVVKQETPGTVLGKGKAKVDGGYESDDFYVDDDDDFAYHVENWTPDVDTYIHEGQPPYEERFDPRFENQPGDNL
ncbi:hypothetical protein B0H13DRAFT_2326280 [Mycena leptocephala]|nr:hypothetical protein B0H13DRAFT_2326280 [Mycena leptocephala]